jgi:geranylgeranylglycerol-phosphate geranylgeranyltransferase
MAKLGKIGKFAAAYVASMRLYYSFVTGIVGWIGVAYYRHMHLGALDPVGVELDAGRQVSILVLLFLAWGINQIFNDFLGLEEDRINAPHRPMVTGQLHPGAALAVSGALVMATGVFVVFFLNPWALAPLSAGVVLNFVYEWAKGHGVWGNIVFGAMVSTGTIFGFMASGPFSLSSLGGNFAALVGLVFLLSAVMTYFTYFKDVEGDEAAGKRTLVVQLGLDRAGRLGLALSLLPAVGFVGLWALGLLTLPITPTFALLGGLAVLLQLWNAVLFFRNPMGKQAYASLSLNFRACCCSFAALVGLLEPQLGTVLFLVTYIAIEFLFSLHSDEKA